MRHNERGAEMMSWLPWYYGDSRIMNEIIHAQSKEIVAVREVILYILAQFYVDTADELGLELWEKELGLTPKEGASKDLRKAQIKAKLQRPPIMTPLQIQSIVNLFVDGRTARVYECPGTYHFRIDIPFGDLIWRAEMLEAVEEAKPAHLGFHLRYTLINRELEDSAELGEDIDEAAFNMGAAIRYEDYIPYGNGIDAAMYDGSLQYGGGQVYFDGKRQYDGEIPYSGFLPGDAPQFGKELPYHFRYNGLAALVGEFQFDGAIRYDGFKPYKLEYDDFLDELGISLIRLGAAGKPSFEDRVDTAIAYDGKAEYEGEATHGASPSPVDVNGDISIRRFRRYDGAIDYGGGDIDLYDGSMKYDGLFDFRGGGNRYELVNISDRLNGEFSIRRPKKGEPLIYRYPEIEEDVQEIFGSYSAQIDAGAVADEDTTLYIRYDGKLRYDASMAFRGETFAPLDEGGDIIITRLRKFDGRILYDGGDIRHADGGMKYDGADSFDGGGNRFSIRRNKDALSGSLSFTGAGIFPLEDLTNPRFEERVPDVTDDLAIQIIPYGIQEGLPLSVGYDGGIFYNGVSAGENSTAIDIGGRIRTERARHTDGSIRYNGIGTRAGKADGKLAYDGAKPYEGGETYAITARQNRSL